MIEKRALIIGIDEYQNASNLNGCVADAKSVDQLLQSHEDKSPNYHTRLLITPRGQGKTEFVTREILIEAWKRLIDNFEGDILFYFSGHGLSNDYGSFLVTHDATEHEPGVHMNFLLDMVNKSKAKEKIIILDCCYSGAFGNPPSLSGGQYEKAQLAEGVTILSASKHRQPSVEIGGHGIFTSLLMGGLSGGAKDVRGRVSAASLYAYTEQALGPWDQTPMYKSHIDRQSSLRLCSPRVKDIELRKLTEYFPRENFEFQLDPSYEFTHKSQDPNHVEIFNLFKQYRNAGLLETVGTDDLYFAAIESKHAKLTELGEFYRQLVEKRLI